MPSKQDRRRRLVLHSECLRSLEKPLNAGAIERAGAAGAIGARKADQQLDIDLLRKSPEGAVTHGVPRFVERHRPEMFGDDAEDLLADVETINAVDIQT